MALRSKAVKQGVKSDTCYALAAEATAREVMIQATIMLENNPDPEVLKGVKEAIKIADKAIEDAVKLREEVIKDGGRICGGPEAYRPPGDSRFYIWVAEVDDNQAVSSIGIEISR